MAGKKMATQKLAPKNGNKKWQQIKWQLKIGNK
jgi:hypothetical protein